MRAVPPRPVPSPPRPAAAPYLVKRRAGPERVQSHSAPCSRAAASRVLSRREYLGAGVRWQGNLPRPAEPQSEAGTRERAQDHAGLEPKPRGKARTGNPNWAWEGESQAREPQELTHPQTGTAVAFMLGGSPPRCRRGQATLRQTEPAEAWVLSCWEGDPGP